MIQTTAAGFKVTALAWENPVTKTGDQLRELNGKIDGVGEWLAYWGNPATWYELIAETFRTGALDVPFMAGSIILIWFIMFGADWPKKYIYWGWVVFWTLRGFIFV